MKPSNIWNNPVLCIDQTLYESMLDISNERRRFLAEDVWRRLQPTLQAQLAEMRDDRNLYYGIAQQQAAAIEQLNARIAELEAALRKAHQLKCYIGNPSAWQNYDESVSEAIREAVNITGKAP